MSNPGGRRLKQWLMEQIQSAQYSGLQWEDESRTMFRIPWKHAGKQDYNQEIDASIFKAWAVFKGKFKEGDKAEPATWKTRLRCALNKSPDFEEVTERSQLDISEPYKVYRIVPEEEQKQGCRISPQQHLGHGAPYSSDSMQSVHFPRAELIEYDRQRYVTRKLLGHLERGVLVRANQEGIFIKRLCQSRVFWSGLGDGSSQYGSMPGKLQRDSVVKIFDTGRFFQALQLYQEGQIPAPDPSVTLCFGEELNDLSSAKSKLIIVQITMVNCQHMLESLNMRRSQPYSSNPNVEMSDDVATEQMARIYQDLCSYSVPQRPACYRDNMPITA
ncbi:hypothetical protein GOODEAATRI_011322 [Goodea atripinnis]|uniref:IRF tryptophan pentad repeat domain-containing protein n=1 Tax=Goodea atripinnis TaxID=208336 RepID=A0ABV0PXD6_9TELE